MKLIALVLLLMTAGCAAKASGTTVQEVVGPGGFRCFAFYNSSGEVVGGNCVKE